MNSNTKIAIIGFGPVGLPLVRLFAIKHAVVGLDINQTRVNFLKSGTDTTFEVDDVALQKVLLNQPGKAVGLY
ncbi:UDP-N-acetyl-D-galactosamine dehydrogenase [Flavobacterium glaciei]|uniref:UDP-N-acetyl-D-galactosamine dehydrogenase n=1 Tax=Flavobacterium glaciei TaxID=386300 RepID=A0A562Q5Z0_9FLAO|nr:UDP-glucose/GDP-mannose dehydrogenase family protein [Flavobacterium glaciei]TWI52171.1 UDP-N-acetyl-D-galactosamine dehydrogenase [Flavobacterium glaciei]